MNTIEAIKKEEVIKGKFTIVHSDTVRFPSGDTEEYLYIERPTSIAIVPVIKKGDKLFTVMVRQHRYPINKYPYQFSMGMCERNKEPINEARRELLEETGMEANHIEEVANFYHDPGVNTQKTILYIALHPHESTRSVADDSKNITTEWVELSELENMINEGDICDALTISIVHLVENYTQRNKELL